MAETVAPKKSGTGRIIDISAPDQTSPDPTSRPVVVTNRPVLTNDPMMVEKDSTENQTSLPTAPAVSRQAKTISPMTAEGQTEANGAAGAPVAAGQSIATAPQTPPSGLTTETNTTATPVPEKHETEMLPAEPEPVAPRDKPSPPQPTVETPAEPERAPVPTEEEAAATKTASDVKQLELDAARHEELESLIDGGTYAVPINAVQRKRTKMIVISLSVLAVVLGLVLLDLALDSHALSVSGLPHTNFFQAK